MYDILSFGTDITEKKVFTFDNRIMGELTHKLRTYGKNVKKAMTLPQKLEIRIIIIIIITLYHIQIIM